MMAETQDSGGYLRVNVTTAGTSLPIAGALITIKTAAGIDSDVVAALYTDESGKAGPIRLAAPPRQNSMQPGKEEVSFRYNIDTDAEGYYSVRNQFVPIYSGVTSIQNVELIPVASGNSTNVYPGDMVRFNESQQPNL